MADYDFRRHLGDRLTLLSNKFFDFFTDGLRTFTLGGMISRERKRADKGRKGDE